MPRPLDRPKYGLPAGRGVGRSQDRGSDSGRQRPTGVTVPSRHTLCSLANRRPAKAAATAGRSARSKRSHGLDRGQIINVREGPGTAYNGIGPDISRAIRTPSRAKMRPATGGRSTPGPGPVGSSASWWMPPVVEMDAVAHHRLTSRPRLQVALPPHLPEPPWR